MTYTVRVSLPTKNALISTDPRDYSLFADDDNVLIKEHSRGSAQVDDGDDLVVNHALGYTPHFYTYAETPTDNRFRLVTGYNLFGEFKSRANDSNLEVDNSSGTDDREIRYFIFYDNID